MWNVVCLGDLVKLHLHALEQEMGFAVGRTRAWWKRLIRR
jgi:hypothetical protein